MNVQKIANHIRELREAQGLSIHELAERAGISVGYLSNLENEGKDAKRTKGADPTLQILEEIAHALGADLHQLIERHEHHGTDWQKASDA